jgi:hypothetical protein
LHLLDFRHKRVEEQGVDLLLVLDIGLGRSGVARQRDLSCPNRVRSDCAPPATSSAAIVSDALPASLARVVTPFGSSVAWVRQLATRTASNCP